MNLPADRDRLVMTLCDKAVELNPGQRAEFLERVGKHDAQLRHDVETLLESISNSGQFLCLDERKPGD